MASTFFGVNASTVPPGKPVEVGIFVNSEGETINAVFGDIVLPENAGVVSLLNGGSLISLWVVPPKIEDHKIHFEGIIPGGLTSSQIPLFSVVLNPIAIGDLSLATENVKVYKHDGLGTALPVRNGKLELAVKEGAVPAMATAEDITPPEVFTPVIVSDSNIENGKPVVIFATSDTESGLDHFEVREVSLLSTSPWTIAESPYLLRDTILLKNVVEIRAIDRAGNIRFATVNRAQNVPSVLVLGGCILFLVIVALLFATFLRKRLWRKQKHFRTR